MSEISTFEVIEAQSIESEHYSHSLRSIRALGRVSLEVIPLTSDIPEVQEAWTDFVSALEENIATDPELSERLTFNPMRSHEVIDGHTVDRTGRPIVDLVSDGLYASRQQAISDKKMLIQVERDEGDVLVAEAVDNLQVGELLATISMDPKEALSADKDFWEDKAYREGMAVLQVYYKNKNGLIAGAYAVKDSDTNSLRELFAEKGLSIPESENCNRWTRHHLKKKLSESEARSFGDNFVLEYRNKRGLTEYQLSTTEFLKQNQEEVQSYFDAHIIPVATSTITGRNNEATKSLAHELHLHNFSRISELERSRLLRVSNSNKFNDDDARFMESKIRYALIEHLRPKLKKLLTNEVVNPIVQDKTHYTETNIRTITQVEPAQLLLMNMHLSKGLGRGVQENRGYGGCISTKTESNEQKNDLGSQDIFGGKSESGNEDSSGDKDEFGPLEFKCTKGHTNKREKGGWVYECKTCGEDVSCGKKK